MGTTRRATAVAVGLAMALAACGGSDSFDESSGAVDQEDPLAEGDVAEDAPAEGDGSAAREGADDVVTFGAGVAAGRQLARTANVTLEVADVEQAAQEVAAAAARAGGFVESANVQGGDFGNALITMRVPAESLDATVEQVGTIGLRVVSSGISTEDLTDQLVDLGARIDNLESLEAELQQLLAQVEDSDPEATQLLTVYERINSTRGEIERLSAQRAAAADRVALATINVELFPEATAPEEVEPTPTDTLGRAWATTIRAFETMLDAVIWIVVTILPVLLVAVGLPALVLYGIYRLIRNRRRTRRPDTTSPPPSSVPPAPGTSPTTTPPPTSPAAEPATDATPASTSTSDGDE